MEKKYTLKEIERLVKKAEKYEELEQKGRLLIAPFRIDATIYRIVKSGGKWKVMQGVFTPDLINEFGKTVFGTEPEAVIAAASQKN